LGWKAEYGIDEVFFNLILSVNCCSDVRKYMEVDAEEPKRILLQLKEFYETLRAPLLF
jgi:hypothetical protein